MGNDRGQIAQRPDARCGDANDWESFGGVSWPDLGRVDDETALHQLRRVCEGATGPSQKQAAILGRRKV